MELCKKLISTVLVAVMLISAAPLNGFVGLDIGLPEFKAEAASVSGGYLTSGYCGDPAEGDTKNVYWELSDEGVLTVTGTGKIAPEAFNYDLRIKEVIISDGITNISDYCFNQCSNLVKVTMGDDVETIGKYAFYNCDGLTDIIFSDSITTVGSEAFAHCDALASVELPDSLTTIGSRAFACCYALTSIELPDSLTTIAGSAFGSCSKLETVRIGAGASSISQSAFSNCSKLSSITVSEENQTYSSHSGILYNKEKTELIFVPIAIEGEITIPATVEKFTYSAVDGCKKITALNVEEGNANYKSVDGIVYSADGKEVIVCPSGKAGTVTIADGTETIGKYAFYNCDSLTNIIFSDSTTKIADGAFFGCSALTNVEFPDSLTTIGNSAFRFCSALTSVEIPKSITKINNYMFGSCGFTELTLPETVQSFDHANWSKLKIFTILNRYCEYTSTDAPTFAKDCTIRAYCGSPGHTLATKRLLNFESIGHTYLDWYVAQPATFEANGIERRDCAYCDGYDERIIPKLESDVFTATFVAGGEVIATVDFPKGTTEIAEPKVPAKDRYIGEWEEYTLADADITINAVYTLIKSEDASEIETDSEVIHYTDKDDVLFKFKAWADALVVKSTVSKSVPLDIVLVVDQSGSMEDTLGGRTKKVDALKDTAKDFVNTVLENAKITGADHRISLVGFGLSGNYQGFEKNENTELLTSANGIVKFDDIKTTDYASSLLSVNVDGAVNSALITAIDSIGARGATAADLGFEMAKGVFANTNSEGRQRVVVFMTDGEPTYLSGFQTSVANAAIYNASLLKNAYDASIYSVGVFSESDSRNRNINKFMNAVSSGYPDAVSMSYLGDGVDGQYYLTVNNTDSLTSVFKSISTESLSHTAPFDDLTVIKTLSEYVTLTSKQEEQLRIDLIRKYGITNDDIIITRNTDGTTTIQINGLTPYETTKDGEVIYEVSVEFFASLNEKAATAGDYIVDTEDSGVMLGEDAKGYEATFETSSISLTSKKTRVIFTVNGEVYEISENISNGYAVIPEIEVSDDWSFSGWDTTSQKATNGLVLDATLTKADRTVTWHTADGDIIEKYAKGDIITAPEVSANANGDIFLSWDKSIPTTMPDENLEFTAVYGGHVHNYTSEVTEKMTCTTDGTRTYICSCGDTYNEVITAIGHNYEAMTPSLDKEDAKCTFCCTNCGDKYDYALNYEVVESTGKKTRVLYEFNLTDDELNTDIQPDGAIQIRIPLSELHGSAEHVTVIRTNEDGSKTRVPAKHEKGFLIITCDHFTPYEVIFDIPCEGHIQGEWVTTKEATCTEEGYRFALCTECEKVAAEETIAKLPHTESGWITDAEASCTQNGKRHTECKVCGEIQKTETLAKKDHVNNNGDSYCDECGSEEFKGSNPFKAMIDWFKELIDSIVRFFRSIGKNN
ncbi:MAG: VWA domain-containing protein [Ruminococcaceae bacterium]|nr:VWA domain-containing protein [Oscillospiraceae bacterium]